jgi:hypothetical protein
MRMRKCVCVNAYAYGSHSGVQMKYETCQFSPIYVELRPDLHIQILNKEHPSWVQSLCLYGMEVGGRRDAMVRLQLQQVGSALQHIA